MVTLKGSIRCHKGNPPSFLSARWIILSRVSANSYGGDGGRMNELGGGRKATSYEAGGVLRWGFGPSLR
jgi:hypothetical protein